ncbi:MAG: 50S ribosomal protein L18 [Candidatus Kapabacteria bacterium]|nr:50S ribosomal protein L18 [Candidatus Kapabacteria bacterium]
MNRIKLKGVRHARRDRRVRKNISGTPDRLRLTVYRSLNHIYAQIINDVDATTVASASTLDKDIRAKISDGMSKVDESRIVGATLAERAKAAKVTRVAFDRNGFLYHGRVKALAESARESGLDF